ncbi:unnamed protein product, partial [Mesorhabditis belari]|uniref:Organic anion transporter n=1 Tax=Mesorhabditis belari TaxID=2138241 RepID=A0AAF3EL65_9BILA
MRNSGQVFYSPCHAGCPISGANFSLFAGKDRSSQLPQFNNCACAGTEDGIVSRSFCMVDDCEWKFKVYFANQAIGAFFGGMSVVPAMLIILRSVDPEHRSVSLGFNGFVVSLFATLPSPIVWGKLIDLSCIAWQKTCSSTGACSLYDNDKLRIQLHVIYGTIRLISLFSDLWVFYWAKGLKLTDEEEEEKENKKDGEEATKPEEEELMSKKLSIASDTRERKATREAIELIQQLEEG